MLVAGGVELERIRPVAVEVPGGVAEERLVVDCRVLLAGCVGAEGLKPVAVLSIVVLLLSVKTVGRAEAAGCAQRAHSIGRVIGAGGVAARIVTVGRIEAAGCVVKERSKTVGRVVVAGGVATSAEAPLAALNRRFVVKERSKTVGRVIGAGCVVKCSRTLAVFWLLVLLLKKNQTVGCVIAAGCVLLGAAPPMAVLPVVRLKARYHPSGCCC